MSGTGVDATSDLTTAAVAAECLPLIGLDFSYIPPSPGVGDVVTFTGPTGSGTWPILLYEWNFDDGSAIATGQVVTHVFPFQSVILPYTVVMTATNACSSATAERTFIVSSYRVHLPVVIRN